MAKAPVCLDSALLERYLRGQVSAVESPPLEDHLARCPACRASLNALRGPVLATHPLSDVGSAGPGSRHDSWATAIKAPAEVSDSAWPAPFPFLAPPRQPDEVGRLAHYRVLKQLGAGGMGMVFLAEDLDLQRLIALKVLLPEAANKAGAGQRFLREARLTAALKSDHIVTIHAVGEDHGVPFLAMELLGASLEGWLRNHPTPDLRQVVRIGREIALGLAAAHQRGLIHRDVKPANVWLEAPSDRVKILDFGLARLVEGGESLTQHGTVLGTPAYMAPEQADGQKADARCDLFSLGCVLFRLCTGKPPFQGGSVLSVLNALATHTPPLVSKVRPDAPPELAQLIAGLLAKEPDDRPSSARAVADQLAAIVVAPAVSSPGKAPAKQQRDGQQRRSQDEKTTPFAASSKAPPAPAPSRRRLRFLAAGAGLLALVLIGIVWFWPAKKGTVPVPAGEEVIDEKEPPAVAVRPPDKGPAPPVGPGDARYKNDVGMEFVLVPKGKAWLDGAGGNPGARQVEIKRDFYLGAYEVTVEEWQKVMGPHVNYFSTRGQGKDSVKGISEAELKKFPVESISWNAAQKFMKRLNELDRQPGWRYCLPTRAQWDYACRGGPSADKKVYNYYLDKPMNAISWKEANVMRKLERTCKVGSYKPNSLGLYDMHGNVAEWTADTEKGPGGVLHGVTREGDWMYPAEYARIQFNGGYDVTTILTRLGFRAARVPDGPEGK